MTYSTREIKHMKSDERPKRLLKAPKITEPNKCNPQQTTASDPTQLITQPLILVPQQTTSAYTSDLTPTLHLPRHPIVLPPQISRRKPEKALSSKKDIKFN